MQEWLEEGTVGKWMLEHFELSMEEVRLNNLRCVFGGSRGHIAPGKYTRLTRNGNVIMSDTPVELQDLWDYESQLHWAVRSETALPVHINGLGMGICTKMALDLGLCVEVIELDPEVIALIGVQLLKLYPQDRLTIIQADALEFKPKMNYCVTWHDIWDDVCGDNLPEYHLLHRRYGRRTKWQGSWGYEELVDNRRRR